MDSTFQMAFLKVQSDKPEADSSGHVGSLWLGRRDKRVTLSFLAFEL